MDELVGRDVALAELRRGVRTGPDGRGMVLLLSGEPGIGKTRLAEEAQRLARADGAETRWATCWDGDGAPAFWPWIQLLRAHAEAIDGDALRHDARIGAAELSRLVPGFAGAEATAPPGGDLVVEDRFRLFDAVASVFERAAARSPLLLVVDDIHRADSSSVDLLRFVASRLHSAPLSIVATLRTGEPPTAPAAVDELIASAYSVELHGLTAGETAELFTDVTGTAPDARLSAIVHERSGGNPLFVRELARLLVAQGRMADPASGLPAVPEAVQPVILRRLGLCTPTCRTFLESAAVLGTQFDADLAARVSGHDEAVVEAVRTGLLIAPAPPQRTHRFVHGVVRDVIYESIEPDDRARLHRAIGDALERSRHHRRDELLMHFAHAGSPDDLKRALRHAQAAAADALSMLAFEEAAALAQRGLDIADRVAVDDGAITNLLLLRGDALNRAGDVVQARPLFLRAAELARRTGDTDALARAALGFGYIPQLEAIGGMGADTTLISLAEEALAMSADDSVNDVLLRYRLAAELVYVEPETFHRLTEDALEIAHRLDHPLALGRALELKHATLFGRDHVLDRVPITEEMIALGRTHGLASIEMRGHIQAMVDVVELGDIAGVDRKIAATERLVAEARLQADRWYPALWRAMRALLDGRLAEAEQLATHAVEIGESQGQGAADHFGMQLMAIRREQRRMHELLELIQQSAEQYPEIPAYRCALAMAYAESGQLASARAEFDRLAAHGFAVIQRDYNFTASLMVLSITCVLLGDATRATQLIDLWGGFEDRFVFIGYAGVCGGAVSHHLGMLAATAGRDDEAIELLEKALVRHRDTRATAWGVRTEIALGGLLAGRDPERSRELLERARATAHELDLVAALADLDTTPDLPSSHGVATIQAATANTAADRHGFRRDGEVWMLTFSGRSVHVRDAKGLRDISILLSRPGQEVHVFDLVGGGGRAPVQSHGGELIDERAKRQYRARIEELQDEIDEATAMSDPSRTERAQAELDTLIDTLSAAYGLGGRPRTMNDPAERARKTVTARIRASIKRIAEVHRPLGEHLDRSVNTGLFCSYTPDRPVRWDL